LNKRSPPPLPRARPSWPSWSRTPSGTSTSLVNELAMFARDPASTCGKRSGGVHRCSATCRSARARGRRPLPADRSVLPRGGWNGRSRCFRFVELADDINSHAGLRCAPLMMYSTSVTAGQGRAHPAARAGLQEKHRRRAGIPGGAGGGPCGCWGRRARGRPARGRGQRRGRDGAAGGTPRRLAAADVVVLLTDHDAFDRRIRTHARTSCRRHCMPTSSL
jgi:hypothetical protein